MLDLVIRGGQVVTPQGVGVWDVGVFGPRRYAYMGRRSINRSQPRTMR